MPHSLQLTLWFTAPALLLLMTVFMLRRDLHREMPWFFGYTIYESSQSIISWFLWDTKAAYFYYYWTTELITIILGFIIIYEVFSNIVTRYERVQRTGLMLYRWSAVVLLFFATITVASAADMNSGAIFDGIVTLQRGVRIIQTGLLVFLFAFASYLALSWRNCAFGVALGFGFLAIVELAMATLRLHFGPSIDQIYVPLKSITYNCAVLIWAAYVLQRQATPRKITAFPKAEVTGWNEVLTEFVRR